MISKLLKNTKKHSMEDLMNFSRFQIENLKIKRGTLHRTEGNSVTKMEFVLLHNTATSN